MRRLLIATAVTAMALALASCATASSDSASTEVPGVGAVMPATPSGVALSPAAPSGVVTITASDLPAPTPVVVTVPSASPSRIVSLASGAGETLAALGVADRVVGRDEASDVPQIHAAPIVTKAHATSAEKVLALKPDLVIADAASAPQEALTQIADAGVKIVQVPEAWTLDDIAARTRAIASAVGVPASAAEQVIAAATSAGGSGTVAADAPRVAFLYLRGTSAIYLVGGAGSGADAIVEAAGGIDAGAEAGYGAFVPLTAEAVAALDPDVILVMTKGLESVGGIDGLVGLPGVAQTPAGRDRRVIAVDDTVLLSFGPRTGALVGALRVALGTSVS